MEQSEGYKMVEDMMKVIEYQLSLCDKASKECEQSGIETAKEIEEHFAKLINALAERKAYLLKQVEQKVINQKNKVEESRMKLTSSIDAIKQTLKSASVVYSVDKTAAEMIWKSLLVMPVSQVTELRVNTKLSRSLFEIIQNHGEVGDSSRFSKAELVSTLAGSSRGNVDSYGANANLSNPWSICFNPHDNCLYFCDYGNQSIKKCTLEGSISTFVTGNNLNHPRGIAMNIKENVFFVANCNAHNIIKISSSGAASIFAGNGQKRALDRHGINSSFNYPFGITIDQQTGNLFVSDHTGHLVRKITPQGEVSTLAGSTVGFVDGNGTIAKFNKPRGICFDEYTSSLIVCDYNNNKLRRVNLNGDVSTLCEIPQPASVTLTPNNTLLVCSYSGKIFQVTQSGPQKWDVKLLAGTNNGAKVDGKPEESRFNFPSGIVAHEPSHSCFVSDYGNDVIRKITFVNPQ